MRTSTYRAFITYVAIFLALGLIFKSPIPVFIAIPFLWIIFFGEFSKFKPPKVYRKIEKEKRFVEGDILSVNYSLEGFGYCWVEDELSTIKGIIRGKVKENEKKELKRFGFLKLREMKITLEDFSGMWEFKEKKKTREGIKVYPRVEYVRKFRIKPRRTRSLLGDYPSRRKGIGTEFTDIREYEVGDPMRRINWKASARKDTLMVNEYESERTGDAVILLDVRRFYKGEEEYEILLGHSVRAAATLVTYLSRTKNRVGLVLLGETVDWVYPAYGKRALLLILEKLLRTRSKKMSRVPFEYAKFIVSRFFPPNSFVIVISPLLSWDVDEAIVELLAKKYDVLIISPSIIGSSEDLATKILRTEREVRLRRLRIYARVVDWDIKYPLTKTLMVVK